VVVPLVRGDEIAGRAPEPGGPAPSGPILYYQDPDGAAVYSAGPRQTTDGREFRAVRASEDISFEDKPPAAAKGPESGGLRRILYYRNPMGLADTSPTPKKDSMGMDYIPVYEGEDESGPVVKVALGKLQRTGVRSEPAERRAVGRLVRVPGTLQLDERRIAVVALRSDAFIEKVADVTTGDRVTKGQALLQLYSPEIAAAGAQYLTDLKIGGPSGTLGGARQRLQNLGVPQEAIAAMARTRKVPLAMPWRAPQDGVVLERNAVDGMKAAAGEVLFRLADISTLWVLADVPEFDLGAVQPGAPATIRVRSLPGETFAGQVALIYPQVSEATRTTRVRIELPNPNSTLLPNMYTDVEIGTGNANPVVAVPNSAVIDTGTRQVVILDQGGGRFEPREVTIGQRGEAFTEIRDGIADGQQVVVAANFLIDAESNLKAALQAMTAPTDPEAQP
jgi:Cu(I)/Ag(I) efflux system membrane fusion protein